MNKLSWITSFSLTFLAITGLFFVFGYKTSVAAACTGTAQRVASSGISQAILTENCSSQQFRAQSHNVSHTVRTNTAYFWQQRIGKTDGGYSSGTDAYTNWWWPWSYGQAAESFIGYTDGTFVDVMTAYYGLL